MVTSCSSRQMTRQIKFIQVISKMKFIRAIWTIGKLAIARVINSLSGPPNKFYVRVAFM